MCASPLLLPLRRCYDSRRQPTGGNRRPMHPRDLAMMAGICLVWALNSTLAKVMISGYGVPPLMFGSLRCLVIALAVSPWLFPIPRPRFRLVASAFLIGGGSFGIFFLGLRDATSSSAAIVNQIGLPITTLLSVAMLGETVRWRRALGMALTLAGTVVVMWDPAGLVLSRGLLLVALAALAGSLGAVMMKQIDGVRPVQFQAWGGFSAVLPLGLGSALLETGHAAALDAAGWRFAAFVLYSALVVSVLCHTAYYGLIRRYEANLVAPLTLMSPLFTVFLGIALLGDPLDLRIVAGGSITLAGVLIIALRPNRVWPRALLHRERL